MDGTGKFDKNSGSREAGGRKQEQLLHAVPAPCLLRPCILTSSCARPLAALLLLAPVLASAQMDTSKLHLPPGFHISIFADTEQSPRMLAFSPGGVLMATATSEGTVLAMPDPRHTGKAERVVTVLKDLNGPHGIAFHSGGLYIAEVGKIVRYDWDEAHLRASNPRHIADLPSSGGGHMTRTILFANGKLYASAGSSCNVCVETDPHRAAVLEMNDDGSGVRVFAHGIRNAVGLGLQPQDPDRVGHRQWPRLAGRRASSRRDPRPGQERRRLRLALVLRRSRPRHQVFQGRARALHQCRPAQSQPAGALRPARPGVLQRQHVSQAVSGQPVRRLPRLLEPQHSHRLQRSCGSSSRIRRSPKASRTSSPDGCPRARPRAPSRRDVRWGS